MELTTKPSFPELMKRAFEANPYHNYGSNYSATTLIMPPRITQLELRHNFEAKRDVESLFASFMGTAIHNHIERRLWVDKPEDLKIEWRLVDRLLDRKISGQPDIMSVNDRQIFDIKTTSVWTPFYTRKKGIASGVKLEWEQQLNIYAYLAELEFGFKFDELYVMTFYRDWSDKTPTPFKDYPESFSELLKVRVWSFEEQKAFVHDRLALHIEAESLPDDRLPHCTEEEVWAKGSTYAVVKKGAKRALRVFDTMAEAVKAQKRHPGTNIVTRHGQRVRCERYCDVAPFCSQYQGHLFRAKLQDAFKAKDVEKATNARGVVSKPMSIQQMRSAQIQRTGKKQNP